MATVKTFYDKQTSTLTHVVYDEKTRDAVVIDPVLDLDTTGWKTYTDSLEELVTFINKHKLKLHYIIDTHVHADHLSGMQYMKQQYSVPLVINAAITTVQETFREVFNLPELPVDGRQFDVLVRDGDHLQAGSLDIEVIHTPGHTPACTTYKIDDALFTGDALFMPDIGTGRCDFPRGSAEDLYDSVVGKLYKLPDDTRVFPGHDYPGQRAVRFETSIAESKASNVDLPADRSRDDYVTFMRNRDSKLAPPRLIYPSVQINLEAGKLPEPQENGTRYLKIPVSAG